jgi:hypothetical protein
MGLIFFPIRGDGCQTSEGCIYWQKPAASIAAGFDSQQVPLLVKSGKSKKTWSGT